MVTLIAMVTVLTAPIVVSISELKILKSTASEFVNATTTEMDHWRGSARYMVCGLLMPVVEHVVCACCAGFQSTFFSICWTFLQMSRIGA